MDPNERLLRAIFWTPEQWWNLAEGRKAQLQRLLNLGASAPIIQRQEEMIMEALAGWEDSVWEPADE